MPAPRAVALPALFLALGVFLPATARAAQQRQTQPPRAQRPQPLVRANGTIDWNRYYNSTETATILRELARRYPRLTELYSIGKSYKGTDLLVIEVTGEASGKAAEKPALYLDGGMHAGELTGSAVALYTLAHLLQNYGKDPKITALLDNHAFYIRPLFNPDGVDVVLAQDQPVRGSVRPWDDDGDGASDEDPPDDLDRDGWITQMRVRDANGDWKLDPTDNRIMVRRTPQDSTGTFYFVASEGIDNDGDGRFNEDGIGGIDLSRNFPRGWQPEHVRSGVGAFPLSEPETWATAAFFAAHPNIAFTVQGHTAGGVLYRPAGGEASIYDSTDVRLLDELGRTFTTATRARGDGDADAGGLIAWAYESRGIPGFAPLFVAPQSWIVDYDVDGTITETEALRFNDERLGRKYFSPWRRRGHPQIGEIEVGGWHTKFWGPNPPPEALENECKTWLPWILGLLEKAPALQVAPRVSGTPDGRVRVDVTVTNTGWLPTNLTERGAVGRRGQGNAMTLQVVTPPIATIEVQGGQISGPAALLVGHLAGASGIGHAREKSNTVTFRVHKTAPELRVTVTIRGGPAGTVASGQIVYR
jgi:hypothetical protein